MASGADGWMLEIKCCGLKSKIGAYVWGLEKEKSPKVRDVMIPCHLLRVYVCLMR